HRSTLSVETAGHCHKPACLCQYACHLKPNGGVPVRFVSLAPAVVALFLSSAACAQSWETFTSRENFFSANFPGTPAQSQMTYTTLKGKKLPASVFTVTVHPGSRLSGTYTITVVDF